MRRPRPPAARCRAVSSAPWGKASRFAEFFPDGDRLVIASRGDDTVRVASFDPDDGVIGAAVVVSAITKPAGIAVVSSPWCHRRGVLTGFGQAHPGYPGVRRGTPGYAGVRRVQPTRRASHTSAPAIATWTARSIAASFSPRSTDSLSVRSATTAQTQPAAIP